ncbi:MAG: hypothetical protein OFPII_15530 [Osedax symbiont Rs1]|nr:MAG: hypothetical protein OFPII_15530 [Osedax symbiont Rs1]
MILKIDLRYDQLLKKQTLTIRLFFEKTTNPNGKVIYITVATIRKFIAHWIAEKQNEPTDLRKSA